MNARLDSLLDQLRQRGVRITVPRRAVLEALLGSGSHMTIDDLAVVVRRSHPEVHISTVYRTADLLSDLGVVEHVHLGHGRAELHMVDETHQHLVCDVCHSVTEVPDHVFHDLAATLDRGYAFILNGRHFSLNGRCQSCQEGAVVSHDPAPS